MNEARLSIAPIEQDVECFEKVLFHMRKVVPAHTWVVCVSIPVTYGCLEKHVSVPDYFLLCFVCISSSEQFRKVSTHESFQRAEVLGPVLNRPNFNRIAKTNALYKNAAPAENIIQHIRRPNSGWSFVQWSSKADSGVAMNLCRIVSQPRRCEVRIKLTPASRCMMASSLSSSAIPNSLSIWIVLRQVSGIPAVLLLAMREGLGEDDIRCPAPIYEPTSAAASLEQ